MLVLRTPDERFAGLPDYPYAARYAEATDEESAACLRLAAVDEGPHATIIVVGHFLQEDQPGVIADVIDSFITQTFA